MGIHGVNKAAQVDVIADEYGLGATLTIEAGKYCRTRDGRKVGPVVAVDDYFAAGEMHYNAAGKCGYLGRHTTGEDWRAQYDLISELVELQAEPVPVAANDDELVSQWATPTVTHGRLVKTPRGYGYELARFDKWSFVDTGGSVPIVITSNKLTAA